jgi:hypothetical protein
VRNIRCHRIFCTNFLFADIAAIIWQDVYLLENFYAWLAATRKRPSPDPGPGWLEPVPKINTWACHHLPRYSQYPSTLITCTYLHGITARERRALNEIAGVNPLLFDFVLKRTLREPVTGRGLPASVFLANPVMPPAIHPAVPAG